MNPLSVGIFNDSFPPTIDGVANTALNYAREIQASHGKAIVATPWYPDVKDDYPFEVVRYPSIFINQKLGYRAGNPMDPFILNRLRRCNLDIVHCHSPFTATVMARFLRFNSTLPIVLTYHTKFDMEFQRMLTLNHLRSTSIRLVVANIHACDEVWVVSNGAGENLRALGYQGDYLVMENGTDFPKGRSPQPDVDRLRKKHGIDSTTPVFLFVGRMMWYKGIRLILEGLKHVQGKGVPFRMVFVGSGYDLSAIKEYTRRCGLDDVCIFTGAIYDRQELRIYFSLARLFLFPSTFDTNGIAVTEAAACLCPSLLIEKSCAAERVTHMRDAFLIKESAEALADAVLFACSNRVFLRRLGEVAGETLYLSWESAIRPAVDRYRGILSSQIPKKDPLSARHTLLREIRQLRDELTIKKIHLARHDQEKQPKTFHDAIHPLKK